MMKKKVNVSLMQVQVKHTRYLVLFCLVAVVSLFSQMLVVVVKRFQVVWFVLHDHCVLASNGIILSERNTSFEMLYLFFIQIALIIVVLKKSDFGATLYHNVRFDDVFHGIRDFIHSLSNSVFETISRAGFQLHQKMSSCFCSLKVDFLHHKIWFFFWMAVSLFGCDEPLRLVEDQLQHGAGPRPDVVLECCVFEGTIVFLDSRRVLDALFCKLECKIGTVARYSHFVFVVCWEYFWEKQQKKGLIYSLIDPWYDVVDLSCDVVDLSYYVIDLSYYVIDL